VFRGDRAKAAELLVLRHENAVLRRHISRVRYDPADRLWFAALAAPPTEALDRDLPRDVDDAAGLAPQTGRDLDASRNEMLLPPGERDTGLKMILLEGGAKVAR
jgi:hypothetical protein